MKLSYLLPKVVGNISTAIQALCPPQSDCGMDGRSWLLRRETGGLSQGGNLSRWGFKTGGKPNMAGFSIRTLSVTIRCTNQRDQVSYSARSKSYVATSHFSFFKCLYLKLLWCNIATVPESQLKGSRGNFMMPGNERSRLARRVSTYHGGGEPITTGGTLTRRGGFLSGP